MNIIKTVALMVLASSLSVGSAVSSAGIPDIGKPVLGKDGRIVCGAKSIKQAQLSPPYHALTVCLDNDNLCYGGEMFDLGAGDISPVFFLNAKEGVIGNSTVLTADARGSTSSEDKLGTYTLSLIFLENGLAKVESQCTLDNPAVLKKRCFSFRIPEYMNLSGEYTRAGKAVAFDAKTKVTFSGDDLTGLKIVFFPKIEQARFSIRPDQCSEISLNNKNLSFRANTNGIMSFLLDISGGKDDSGQSESAPNGLNVWDVDKLHFPDYGACSNLVQNPSFEAGLRYWGYRNFASGCLPLKYTNIYELDAAVAHTGQNSLRIRALAIDNTLPLGNYPLPYIPGEKYTLSFYAKGSAASGLALNIHGRGRHYLPFGQTTNRSSQVGTYAVGKEWQRYSFSFSALENFIAIYFAAKASSQAAEGYVWVDDVQIEKGAMTDFKQAPYTMQLLSAARGNFLEYEQHPDFRLAVQSLPNAAGTVSIFVEDFFYRHILQKEFKFKTDAAGKAVIALAVLDDKVMGDKLRGVFSVNTMLKIDGNDRPYNDYFRFSVMNFLENKHKNKNIFSIQCTSQNWPGGPDFERFLAHARAIGIGSANASFINLGSRIDPDREAERIQVMERYGIIHVGRNVANQRENSGEIYEANGALIMTNIINRINPSAGELAEFEHICEVKAKNRPWFKIWWFSAESHPGMAPLESHPESFAKFLLATLRGIKKGNPNAKVLIEGGPWTIAPDKGGKWMERYIQDTKKIDPTARFDGAAGHYYCDIPESYDLDENVGQYIKMLDRNGCANWPLYLNEGGNYSPMNIPSLGISPYVAHSLNSWFMSPFTYHMGRAERISAAYSARSWLVGLKYQDRVKCMVDFQTPSRYQDIDLAPRAFDKIPNTLGRLLGDASFYKDIRFAPFCRCYVFKEDKTGAPIAVVWGHKETVDRWKEEPPKYKFNFGEKKLKFMDILKLDFGRQGLRFVDLMENETSFPKDADGFTVIPVSPFPLFIKGAPGTLPQLCEQIAAAAPVTGGAGGVKVTALPCAGGKAAVVFTSRVSREYAGDAKVVINGVESKWPLKIPSLGSKEELVTLAPAVESGTLQKFAAEYAIAGDNSGKISGDYILLKNKAGITVDGDLSDWKGIPAIDLGAGVLMHAVMVGKKVMIAIRVTGKNISAEDVFAGVGLYIDPFEKTDTWTDQKTAAGIAGDLGIYEIQKSKEGGMDALCRYSQGMLAGIDKDLMIVGKVQKLITVQTTISGDASCMEIEVPEKIFAPLTLAPGSRFGLNISVPLKGGGIATLAPVSGFVNVAEPGKINFVMVVIGK